MNDPREEKVVPMRTFDVMATYTIQKKASVVTRDYSHERDYNGDVFIDNSRTDWRKAYKEDHYTIPEILEEVESLLKEMLRRLPEGSTHASDIKKLLADCEGWKVEEETYEEA